MKKTFAELFKKYRLRAEFEKLSELGEALVEKGMYYEDSIFSHWQKGSRIPRERNVLLTLLDIFIEHHAITSLQEANEFLESTGQGYLTQTEAERLPLMEKPHFVFQVPSDIINFTGRKNLIHKINQEIHKKQILFIHGQPGVGKTSLAIRLGHILSENFSDGVLWYKVDSSRIMDILLSIAATFGENIAHIEDVEIRASVVRSILANKKVLLILDSVDDQKNLYLLLPSSSSSLTIITSRNSTLRSKDSYIDIHLTPFTGEEVLQLFSNIFDKKFLKQNQKIILAIGEKVGNLPLAVHMLAKQLLHSQQSISTFLEKLDKETISLTMLSYDDKNLALAVQLSYDSLSEQEKKIFVSLGIFEGKDFSLETIAYINNLSLKITEEALGNIINASLIEHSNLNRYRIHPMIKQFAREKIIDTTIYLRIAIYYEKWIIINEKENNFKILLKQEADNIIAIFNQCYRLSYWDEVTKLWNLIERYFDTPQQRSKILPITETIDTKPGINFLQKILIVYISLLVILWIIIQILEVKTSILNYFYSFGYGLISLLGGFLGIFIAKSWGIKRSILGRSILFVSLGSLCWGTGQMIWSYYNLFKDTAVPFPSLADVGYSPSYFLWAIGMIFLSFATGVNIALKKKRAKISLVAIPIIVLFISYFLLVEIARKGVIFNNYELSLKFFLGISYPASDVITLSLSLTILSIAFKFLGGKYKKSFYALLFGFGFMYIADFLFSFTTTYNTFYNGNLDDLFFTIGLSFITFGIFGFYQKKIDFNGKSNSRIKLSV